MLKTLAFLVLATLSTPAAWAQPTERLRQYNAETATPAARILTALKQRLPKSVAVVESADGASLHYTGNTTPAPLADFLTAAFEQLDPAIIAMGQTVSLTLMLSDIEDATDMSLMVLARFPDPVVPLMEGAMIMLDGTGRGDCAGHMVLAHPLPTEEAAPAYREHLENEGFAFPDADPEETSFFIGHRPGCDLALYLQEDQGTSLIVIRYLED